MAKCTGRRCPMQVGFKVNECNYKECPHRTEPITNADKIRAMSDEDLADVLRIFCIGMADCEDCPLYRSGCPMSSTFNDWMKWLQQQAEVDYD